MGCRHLYYFESNQVNTRPRIVEDAVKTQSGWDSIDKMAEQMFSYSPYSYAFNGPIYFFDHGGNIPIPQIINYTRISSHFGLRIHPIRRTMLGHTGVDLVASTGTNVRAAARGTVAKVGWDPRGYGRYIVIQHSDGYYTLYGHLERSGTMVAVGDNVYNGQLIATSGNTGGSTGPHLHFEIVKANSISGVFNRSNKVNPESIYDLDQKLHGGAMPSLLTGTSTQWNLFWSKIKMETLQAINSVEPAKASAATREKLTPIEPLTPQPITPTPTPEPTPEPINPVPPAPAPMPPMPDTPPQPRID